MTHAAGCRTTPGAARPLFEDDIEVDVDAICDGHRCRAGVIGTHRGSGVHSGDSACSLPPHSLPNALAHAETKRSRDGESAQRARLIDVRSTFSSCSGRDVVTCLEVNPACVAPCRLCHTATGRAAGQGLLRAAWRDQSLAAARHRRRSAAAVFLGEGSGIPVQQVPRCRYHPRPRDEIDR